MPLPPSPSDLILPARPHTSETPGRMETILHVATVAEVACPTLKLGVGGGAHDATPRRPKSWVRAKPTRSMQDLATAPFNYSIRGRKPKIVPQKHPKRERTPTHAFPKNAKKRAWCAKNGKALPKCVPKKGKQRARVFDRSFPFRAFIEGPF